MGHGRGQVYKERLLLVFPDKFHCFIEISVCGSSLVTWIFYDFLVFEQRRSIVQFFFQLGFVFVSLYQLLVL